MQTTVVPLEASTREAFADLVERNGGAYGGCWCIGHHPECGQRGIDHRAVEEPPGLTHRREDLKDPPPRPDWRTTCVDVEALSEVTAGRAAQGRFLFSATTELFEDHGFTRGRQVGEHAWIPGRVVRPAP